MLISLAFVHEYDILILSFRSFRNINKKIWIS